MHLNLIFLPFLCTLGLWISAEMSETKAATKAAAEKKTEATEVQSL